MAFFGLLCHEGYKNLNVERDKFLYPESIQDSESESEMSEAAARVYV